MPRARIAVSLEQDTVRVLDRLVAERLFPSRSEAIQAAVSEKLERLGQSRLARECAKLDPQYEKALAEEGISGELAEWAPY